MLLSEKIKKAQVHFYSIGFLYIRPAAGMGDGVGECLGGWGLERAGDPLPFLETATDRCPPPGDCVRCPFSREEEPWHLLVAMSVLVTTYPRTENTVC